MCVIKNWDPLVAGPELAIDNFPGLSCFRSGWISSSNLYPGPPVPVPDGQPPCIMKSGITLWNFKPS